MEQKNIGKTKKPIYKKWWFWVIIAVLVIGIGSNANKEENKKTAEKPSTSQSSDNSKKEENNTKQDETSQDKDKKEEDKEDLSSVAKEYTIKAGNYVAGIDLPSGSCNIVAVSGNGNLTSSNIYNGGVNEVFGIDDGSGFYNSSFNGLNFPKDTVLSTNGNLVVKLTFTEIKSNFKGRTYDENASIELGAGNYTSGVDFPVGVYKIIATSGNGNISSSNLYDGGVNEVFGIDDGTGFYNSEILNITLPEGETLSISGGLKIKLIPAKNN